MWVELCQDLWIGVSRDLLISFRGVGYFAWPFGEFAVHEVASGADQCDEFGGVDRPPPCLCCVDEFVGHRDAGGAGAGAFGDALAQAHGGEGRLNRIRGA